MTINNIPILNNSSDALLSKKNISISMNVYDSDEENVDKPTIVFIHGNSTSQRVFEQQVNYFSENFRVITLDLLGHGRSTKVSEFDSLNASEKDELAHSLYNPSAMIAEVVQVLQQKSVKNAHIIGWSLGAHIAYGIAVENPFVFEFNTK